jgi:hypothetical protein
MEWKATWNDPLTRYLAPYHELIGDKRTHNTFDEVIKGIMGAGSLICQRIAAHSAQLAQGKKGSQRIIRLASGESTKRSSIDAEHLTAQLRTDAADYLGQASDKELWVVADCSDLRKPYASELPYLSAPFQPWMGKDWCLDIEPSMCWELLLDDEGSCIIAFLAVRPQGS